jgi:hypothetical protein
VLTDDLIFLGQDDEVYLLDGIGVKKISISMFKDKHEKENSRP